LALSLALIALGGAYLLVMAPIVDFYGEREARLETRRVLLPRLEAAAAELPALRSQLTELRSAARARKFTLDGASDAIASANLQSRIEGLAASAGIAIGSTESLPAETRGGYRRIGLRFALSGPYETLVKLIAALETAAPPLVIDNLQIHGVLRRPGLPPTPGYEPGLDAGLDVYAFRSNDKTAAAKP
jgi:general secretion pathway protein M